jgi:hypothetical protein
MRRGASIDASAVHALADEGRLLDIIGAAAEAGVLMLRFGVPWATMEPRAGSFDGAIIERYREAAERCVALGVEPWFTLLQTGLPQWFDNEGGFTDSRLVGRFWPRWVEQCAAAFGDLTAGWVPFETPFAMARRLVPDDPRRHGELMDTLVVAWRDAWRILRGGPPVATSLDVCVVRPADATIPAAQLARREDQLRWGLWLDGFGDGIIRIPGRADRELADLAGACDIVGIAIRADAETVLYRIAEMANGRPLALTYRCSGLTDTERANEIRALWNSTRHAQAELDIVAAWYAPLLGDTGLLDPRGELGEAGITWLGNTESS